MNGSDITIRLRLVSAGCLALLIAVLGASSIYRKVESFQPLGFEAFHTGGQFHVTEVALSGTGLEAGDSLLFVGSVEPATSSVLRAMLLESPESRLQVIRGTELVAVTYERPGLEIDIAYLALAVSGIVYLLVGLYALFNSRKSPSGLFFLWCAMSATVSLLTFVPSAAPDAIARTIFAVEEAARLLLPPLTVHLFMLFPTTMASRTRLRVVAPFLYLPTAVLGALQADLAFNGGRAMFGAVTARSIQLLDRLELTLIVFAVLVAVVLLLWQAARIEHWKQRRQLQWIAAGLSAGYVPFLALYVVPWGLSLAWPTWTTVAAVIPLSLVPLTFAWAILRYRLWDLELILRDAASYAATLLLGTLSFSLLHIVITRGLTEGPQLARNVLTFVAGLAVAGILVPTQRVVRSGLERLRHRDSWERREVLSQLGQDLLQERRLDALCRRLLDDLRVGLGASRLDLYLLRGARLDSIDPSGEPGTISRRHLAEGIWTQRHQRLPAPAALPTTATPLEAWFAAGYRSLFPLVVRERPVGILVVGHHDDGLPLDSEETEQLRSLLDHAALALENASLVSSLADRLEELDRLKQFSEQILESSPAGIVVIDEDDRIVSANSEFRRFAAAGVIGARLTDVLPIPIPEAGGPSPATVSFREDEGTERYVQVSAKLTDDDRSLRVLVVQDISEQVAMERALEEKERLAALGMLAAGVAHEVNTPITGISSYTQMLLSETSEDDPRYSTLQKMERQTFRAARIVNNLLELAREKPLELSPVVVEEALEEALETAEAKLQSNAVEVVWEHRDETSTVLAGEVELQRVFANLAANAADAMAPEGGKLQVSVERHHDRVIAVFEDTGCGMSQNQLAQIFEPFYTTKTGAGGTGLGLAMSYQIVQRFGGELKASSSPDEGSRFEVHLPLFEGGGEP